MRVDRRLHADGAQQLQRVVLHHVAQGAGGFVEGAAFLDADFLGDRDLDVGDMFAPPQRLEQRIAEAQGEQVLHRRFAQVVVDAEHLRLPEDTADRAVDRAVGGEVVAERFFQHHAGVGRVQPDRRDLLADGGEQGGGRGHVHHDRVGIARAQRLGEAGVVVGPGEVHAHEIEQCGETRELVGTGALGQLDLVKAAVDQAAVLLRAEVVAADADDAAAFGQRAMAKRLEQCRHEFAPGEIARAAEQDKIKGHGLKVTRVARINVTLFLP